MNNHSTKQEPITPERIAKAAGILAYLVENYGDIHREMFIQFMQQYRTALKFENDLPLALSWYKNGYRKEDIPLETKPPAATEIPRLLTMKAAAAYVGVSVPTFVKWVAAGLFPPSVSITKMWDRKAIDAQLDKLSGLDAPEIEKEDSFDIWKRNRDAKKAAGLRRGVS